MNTQKFGEWLAIGTNVAVLAGIAALAYEINQNTRQMRAQASYNLLINRTESRSAIANNPEIAEFWARVEDGSPLSDADRLRVKSSAEVAILKWHWDYGQYVDGSLSLNELPVAAYRAAYRGEYGARLSGVPDAWHSLKDQLRPDFVNWMEVNVIE